MSELVYLAAGTIFAVSLVLVLTARRSSPAVSWRAGAERAGSSGHDRDRLVRDVLEELSEGVIVLNEMLRPALANQAARKLLHIGEETASTVPVELLSLARRAVVSNEPVEEIIDLWIPARTSLFARAAVLDEQSGVLLTVKDVTAEQRTQRMRRQFVTHASHELKSPVAGIQALAEAIEEAASDDPKAALDLARRLVRESERLGRLVDDLLDLSRVEDPASFSEGVVDLSRVVAEEVRSAEQAAAAKDLVLTLRAGEGIHVRGDDRQMALLVRNLVDNALRYTPGGGSIAVSLSVQGQEAVLAVQDTGIGIPLKAQGRVFERFFRVDEARAREDGGTGLGLAIVKHVADLYGGRVEVESEYGEGSTFSARLPLVAGGRGMT